MSILAYGWVEHCSDIAGCGTSLFQDKYFLCVISATVYFLMNYDEHVECLNEMYFFCCILHVLYICVFFQVQFILYCVMGL